MASFFAMGGYAVFVWPAYVITLLVLVTTIVLSLQAHARARNAVRRLEAEEEQSGADKT